MMLLQKALLIALTRLLRGVSRDFPGRWRLEHFAVREARTIASLEIRGEAVCDRARTVGSVVYHLCLDPL